MCGAQCKKMSNCETVMNLNMSVTQPVIHPGHAAHSQGPLKMDKIWELPGQYRPKLGLSPPEPRMETDLERFPGSFGGQTLLPDLTSLAGFSGIPKRVGEGEVQGSTLGDFW